MNWLLNIALAGPTPAEIHPIVQGEEALDGDFPEVVMLQLARGRCTGSLIHREWVLTAAHCFDDIAVTADDDTGGNPDVIFGTGVDNVFHEVTVDRVILHDDYVPLGESLNGEPDGTGITRNDIALVHLEEAVGTDFEVMAVNTTALTDDWVGDEAVSIGFGITEFGGENSGTKRFVERSIHAYSEQEVELFTYVGGPSTCQGDSGGPTVVYQGGGYIQIGVTSTGIACNQGPSTAMRVDAFVPWMQSVLPVDVALQIDPIKPLDVVCSHQLDTDDPDSIALGVVPMTLRCVVDSADPETLESVSWVWGDGQRDEGLETRMAHTYTDMGIYTLSVCFTGTRGENPYEDCVLKSNHVNACAVPEVAFDASNPDGLEIEVVNATPLRAHTCISNAVWEVYEGDSVSGEPIATYSNWEPQIAVERRGTYTVVLNVGGLGGTGAARAVVEVGRGIGCSTSGTSGFGLLPLLALAVRRRR